MLHPTSRRLTGVSRVFAIILIVSVSFDPTFLTSHASAAAPPAQEDGSETGSTPESSEAPASLEAFTARVRRLELCPRRLVLYPGESYALVAVPFDAEGSVVHGANVQWSSDDAMRARVDSSGTVTAIAPGRTLLSARSGSVTLSVGVEVRDGARTMLSDEAWDQEHEHDCEPPDPGFVDEARGAGSDAGHRAASPSLVVRPAASRRATSLDVVPAVLGSLPRGGQFSGREPVLASAVAATSAAPTHPLYETGAPRFSPVEDSFSSVVGARYNFGSANYQFAVPIISLPGRESSLDLALVYNSQLWTVAKTSATQTALHFDYHTSPISPGWRLNLVQLIPNYDYTGTGTLSASGSANAPGNALLVEGDGTRIELTQSYDATAGIWTLQANDGSFTKYMPTTGKLVYADSSVVTFSTVNNVLQPTSLQTRNGNVITISYKTYNAVSFPERRAIDTIQDTVGRYVRFYYGEGKYDDTCLSRIAGPISTKPGYEQTILDFGYQNKTLNYTFSISPVSAPTAGSSIRVLKRITMPETGRGYLFTDYSTYGMIRRVSARRAMNGSTNTEGTESAYSEYDYPADTTASGTLSEPPRNTTRKEYWTEKTDDAGSSTTSATTYTYGRSTVGSTKQYTVTHPTSTQNPDARIDLWTVDDATSSNAFGKVQSVAVHKTNTSTTPMAKTTSTYTVPTDGGLQLDTLITDNEASQSAKVDFDWGSYGRVTNVFEYGFASGGSYTLKRERRYSYLNTTSYLDARMLRL